MQTILQKTTYSYQPSPLPPSLFKQKLEAIVQAGWQRAFYRRHWPDLDEVFHLIHNNRFHELPVIRKTHLRQYWADIMRFEETADVVSSSGTTGRPVDVPVCIEQEEGRVFRVRRLLRELGVRPGARVLQLLSLNDLFTLGPLVWQAIKAEGACAIRCTPQRLDRVLQAIEYLKPEFVVGNPFTLVRMAEQAGSRWPTPDKLPNRAFLAVAATSDAALKPTPVVEAVQRLWDFDLHINQYGTSELGPVAHECTHHQGLHVHADFHYLELIDPSTGSPVTDPHQPGEIVVTALTQPRGFLPIRYAPGDMAYWLRHDPCPCGRTTPRLGSIMGRVDHQLKVYGQTVFPDLLLNIADENPFVKRSAVRVRSDQLGGDEVSLLVVPTEDHNAEAVRQEVAQRVSQNLAVAPQVEVITEAHLGFLEQSSSKGTNMVKIPRFFDFRGQVAA